MPSISDFPEGLQQISVYICKHRTSGVLCAYIEIYELLQSHILSQMTSVDSGVETGNDSNDSYANHEAQTSNIDASPSKPGITPTALVIHTPSHSSEVTFPKREAQIPMFRKQDETRDIDFLLPLQRDFSSLGVDAPAGISFCNLQPSSLGLGNGYEVVRAGNAFDLSSVYQKLDFPRKIRAVRCRLRRTSEDIRRLKIPLSERKLRHACSTNNVELVSNLLDSGVSPNCYDNQRRSPLHLAACRGYADVVRILLEKGANPNQRDSLGNTPLHLAACTNNVVVVTLLLKAGTDVSSNDYFGRNPLQLAQSKLKLLQRGSDNEDSKFIKGEVQKVIDMMIIYLQKRGQQTELELLSAFSSRVTLSNSKDEVETDVRDLLASLNNLSINVAK